MQYVLLSSHFRCITFGIITQHSVNYANSMKIIGFIIIIVHRTHIRSLYLSVPLAGIRYQYRVGDWMVGRPFWFLSGFTFHWNLS